MRLLLAVVLISASTALAQSHRGSLGLTVAGGYEYATAIKAVGGSDIGSRIPLEIGGTLGIFDHSELRLAGRLAPGFNGATLAGSIYAGIRSSFGHDAWKTFFDFDVAAHVAPSLAIGGRVGFGVQYDFLPIMGVYAEIGGQFGGGQVLRLSFEAVAGLQFRTYLFE